MSSETDNGDGEERRALMLAAVPASALLIGGLLWQFGRGDIAHWLWIAGIVPVLVTLLLTILRSLARGDFGLDIIAGLAMGGAVATGEALAGCVVALMLSGGEALESYAQRRARKEMTALLARVPREAAVYRKGGLVVAPIDDLQPGDRILVRSGEVLPVDGHIAGASATLDESALTGEAVPVTHGDGDEVESGATNVGAPFDLVAIRTAANSTYAGIVRLVEGARHSKAPMSRLADQYALGFLAVTLALTFAAWWFTGDPRRALAVLVVATPCPLILAVPVAIVAGMSRCARRGALVKSAAAFERLARVRSLLIDKTGTLTSGNPHVVAIESAADFSETQLIAAAASLAQGSQHVVSRALVEHARNNDVMLVVPEEVMENAGVGVIGRVEGRKVAIGRPDMVGLNGHEHLPGTMTVAVSLDGRVAGYFRLADPVRPEAAAALAALRAAGVERIVLVTGDQDAIARSVADELKLDAHLSQTSPAQKLEAVREAARLGPVMMAGDGVNDAPALAAADVGVAIAARGTAAASEAADVILVADRIDRMAEAMLIAQRTRRIAVESVLAGIGLSTIGMVAAALGYLTPLAGALTQEAIDVAVVLNALRALSGGRREAEIAASVASALPQKALAGAASKQA